MDNQTCAEGLLLSLELDWLQSLKQFFIIYVISYTCNQFCFLKTEPSELDWLQVYDITHMMKNYFKEWSLSR